MQEVALAKTPKILCGMSEFSWGEFEIATRILARCALKSSMMSKLMLSIQDAFDLVNLRGRYKLNMRSATTPPIVYQIDQQWSIGRLAWDMKDRKCKDDRDRIYALLSLTSGEDSLKLLENSPAVLELTQSYPHGFKLLPSTNLMPDYTKPVEWVYHQFWKDFGGCTSLFYAGLSRRRGCGKMNRDQIITEDVSQFFGDNYLPSWVPDLRSHSHKEWSPIFGPVYGTSTPFQHMVGTVNQGPGMLMIRGHRFDIVSHVFPSQDIDNWIELRTTIKLFLSLESKYAPYPNGQAWIEALGSTLMMDEPYNQDHPFQMYVDTFDRQLRLSDTELRRIWKLYQKLLLADTGEVWKQLYYAIRFRKVTQLDSAELSHDGQLIWLLHRYLGKVLQAHCLIITKQGYMGLAPPDTLIGDVIAVLGGPSVPFVIRDTSAIAFGELEANEAHGRVVSGDIGRPMSQLLGPCYLQGIMKAELLRKKGLGKKLEWETDKLGMIPKPTLYLI